MEKLQKKLLTLCLFLMAVSLTAQKGTIRGKVYDDLSGEPIMFGTVLVKETSTGTDTDLDGAFSLSLDPGTYTLVFSYISYADLVVSDIVVTAGEITEVNGRLQEESEMIEEVVITATQSRNTEIALTTVKRKATNLLDGISAAKFKKIGDSNAADAVKRVTGVSVEGGKYVFVRGLGDRYSKTMLNGVEIPGLDPDRNSLQIDIFPTNLINNMVVYKSSLAELPADFTGGLVNIETKDFPEERMMELSLGLGFNPSMHLNSEFLTYAGGSTDWLGIDDGTRKLQQLAFEETVPSPISGHNQPTVQSFVSAFNPTLDATTKTSMPDFSIGLSYGDQKNFKNDNSLGYIFSGAYRSSRSLYQELQYGEYQKPIASDEYEQVYSTTLQGDVGEENILVGGMAGLAFKTKYTKHKLNVLHLQNGESKAAEFAIDNNSDAIGQSGYLANSDNLEYSQRRITNVLLNGRYTSKDSNWDLDWRVSPTWSSLTDPDIRKTAYSFFGGDNQQFVAGAGGNPSRLWRYLDEVNLNGKVDLTKKFQFKGEEAKLKFGFGHVYKERDYNILAFDMQFFGTQPTWTGNPSEVLTPENIYPGGVIYYASGNNTPNPNEYNSNVNNTSAYVSADLNLTSKLKMIAGLRAEKFTQRHTGRDIEYANFGTGNNLENQKVLDSLDLFPSLNLVQSISDKQNVRVSYSRSIARPSFKELSFAQILDPISNRIFNGSLFQYEDWGGNLSETRINNFDLRWEMYQDRGQLYSISAFVKTFDNPIELVRIPAAQTSNEFQPRNVGDGQVFGIEMEVRKALDFLSPKLEGLSFNTNVTVVESSIEMTALEYDSRKAFEKEGETINDSRQMAGQAPFIVNAGLSYQAKNKPLDMGLFYNVKGRTLAVVGGGLFPDVYARPFHSLNFSLNNSFGEDEKVKMSLNVNNILNSSRESVFQSYNAADQIFSSFDPGLSFGISFGFRLL